MKAYVIIYLEFFGFGTEDFIPCEVCGGRAVDIHHIDARGMGGSGEKDVIENLMAMCRKCHTEFGDITEFMAYLIKIHRLHMDNGPQFTSC